MRGPLRFSTRLRNVGSPLRVVTVESFFPNRGHMIPFMRWRVSMLRIAFTLVVVAMLALGCEKSPSAGTTPGELTSEQKALLAKWPPIEMPSIFDVGELAQDEKVSRTIDVKNVGDKPLRILSARSNCTCTTADVSGTVIQPGEVFPLPIEFAGEGRTGRRSAEVRLEFEGYDNRLMVRIEATVTAATS